MFYINNLELKGSDPFLVGIKKKTGIIILIVVSLIVGSVFGYQTAFSLCLFSEDISRGVLAAGTLQKLEGYQNENVRKMFETDIDDALVRYSYAEEEWWFDLYQSGWLIIIQIDNIELDKWIRYVAVYRKRHLSQKSDPFEKMSEKWWQSKSNQEMVREFKDRLHRIDEMVEAKSGEKGREKGTLPFKPIKFL